MGLGWKEQYYLQLYQELTRPWLGHVDDLDLGRDLTRLIVDALQKSRSAMVQNLEEGGANTALYCFGISAIVMRANNDDEQKQGIH